MPKDQIKQLLLALKEEASEKPVSDEQQAQLQQIEDDVNNSIAEEPLNEDLMDIQQTLEALEVEFEVSHPSIAYIIKNIIETLAKMGV